MKKYEYQVVEPNDLAMEYPEGRRKALDLLNDLGQEGWQLITINQKWKPSEEWLMVREIPDE